jgi:hypothetical protein
VLSTAAGAQVLNQLERIVHDHPAREVLVLEDAAGTSRSPASLGGPERTAAGAVHLQPVLALGEDE